MGVVVSAGILQALNPGIAMKTRFWYRCSTYFLYRTALGFFRANCSEKENHVTQSKELIGCLRGGWEATHDVFERLCDGQAGVAALHDHGRLHVLHQLGRAALQEALGALGLGLPVGRHR